ncbi:MAG: chemotaxis protein CheD, partial [Bacteroidales bacterium]|nr:chemotaxis protein CheD [Bacteroidales bacterium]
QNMIAKIFGGGEVLEAKSHIFNIGHNNIQIAKKLLNEYNIKIVSTHVGGKNGRKIRFYTDTGQVGLKVIPQSNPTVLSSNSA